MDINIFLMFFWVSTVYQTECAIPHGKPKRNKLSESAEPHPYTISFFTFPTGTELIRSKITSKRNNEDLPAQNIVNLASGKESEKNSSSISDSSVSDKHEAKPGSSKNYILERSKVFNTKRKLKQETAGKHASSASAKNKMTQPFVQVYEKPNALDKAGKAPEVGPQKGNQKVEPWKIGTSHNKVQLKVHQKQMDEPYQEGSINHPSHTMYPECHHCPSNSSYEECTKTSTLAKCNNGLNNICFTKSFRSATRGRIYQMGCSNHFKCRKAKATPCEGKVEKCFVCCQYDGCNGIPHHNLYTTDSSDEIGFEYLNEAAIHSSSKWITGTVVLLQGMLWMIL